MAAPPDPTGVRARCSRAPGRRAARWLPGSASAKVERKHGPVEGHVRMLGARVIGLSGVLPSARRGPRAHARGSACASAVPTCPPAGHGASPPARPAPLPRPGAVDHRGRRLRGEALVGEARPRRRQLRLASASSRSRRARSRAAAPASPSAAGWITASRSPATTASAAGVGWKAPGSSTERSGRRAPGARAPDQLLERRGDRRWHGHVHGQPGLRINAGLAARIANGANEVQQRRGVRLGRRVARPGQGRPRR